MTNEKREEQQQGAQVNTSIRLKDLTDAICDLVDTLLGTSVVHGRGFTAEEIALSERLYNAIEDAAISELSSNFVDYAEDADVEEATIDNRW